MSSAIIERLERVESLLLLLVKDVLTAEEAATLLGISAQHLRRIARERQIPYYRQGRNIYFSKVEIQQELMKQHYPAKSQIIEKAYRP